MKELILPRRIREEIRVWDYNIKSHQIFDGHMLCKGETCIPQTRFYGIELEVEVPMPKNLDKDTRTKAYTFFHEKCKHFAFTKSDSSLTHGFEICTVPGTLAAHRVAWESFFWATREDKIKYFKAQTLKTKRKYITGPASKMNSFRTTTCGMHIHVTRKSISPINIVRIWKFINKTHLEGYLERIAGRKMNHYSSFTSGSTLKLTKQNQIIPDVPAGKRHTALNISNNNTIEFRIFKGNTDPIGFFKNLDFVASLIEFCETSPSIKVKIEAPPKWKLGNVNNIGAKYIEWVTSPSVAKRYPYFYMWVKRHKFSLLQYSGALVKPVEAASYKAGIAVSNVPTHISPYAARPSNSWLAFPMMRMDDVVFSNARIS